MSFIHHFFFFKIIELLDEQEFNEESETNAYNESSVNPAEELGLLVGYFHL